MSSEFCSNNAGIELSIVVPTFNESSNISNLFASINAALSEISWELIIVDDASPDDTGDVVRELARRDPRIRLISRHNRRGLSSAVVEGVLAASAEIVAVMDGDLQHDESILPELYDKVASGEADVASASRFLDGSSAGGLSSQTRLKVSNSGIWLANKAFKLNMTDPLTGFFVVRRDVLVNALPDLSEQGFKILLDLITAAPSRTRIIEVPFKFRERFSGQSKLDSRVMYDFFLFLIEKKISRFIHIPAQFISFSLINGIGIFVHLAVLAVLISLLGRGFASAQLVATLAAMIFNYSVNNLVTYNDRQLKGAAFWSGFVIFAVLCSVGVFGNLGVATVLHSEYGNVTFVFPAVVGALVTVVWNYVATTIFVWGRNNRKSRVITRRHGALTTEEVVHSCHRPNKTRN